MTTGRARNRACGDGEDREEAGKDGADAEDVDDCSAEEQVGKQRREASWHGRTLPCHCHVGWPLFQSHR